MSKRLSLWSLPAFATSACFVFVPCLTSCSKDSEPPVGVEEETLEEVEVPALESNDAADPNATVNGDESADTAESNEITVAMAELSAADRTAALAQKICPVSGEPLGSMGAPIKVTADGHEVFLCCAACKEKFESDPEQYLAKLKPTS